ncbi:MAG: aspartoacylase [Candidatus Competibacteraceae bacterium]|nr:aspartoacylase [Candidatus Competibacteraceae bacterium]
MINTVVITAATHGNELTGLACLKRWRLKPEELQRASISCSTLIANKKAVSFGKRYVDGDLNRQFSQTDLQNLELANYEANRAKALNQLLGPKESPKTDFIIDLHTTTANMGLTLVIHNDSQFHKKLAAFIKQKMPSAIIFFEPKVRMEDNFLISIAKYSGFLIEVGPTPQGLVRSDIFELTRQATMHALDFIHAYNTNTLTNLPKEVKAYQFIKKIKLPCDENEELTGMIHPDLQDKDYQPISPGTPIFLTFTGETIRWEGEEVVYGAFINEAAYYDQLHGLSILRAIDLTL